MHCMRISIFCENLPVTVVFFYLLVIVHVKTSDPSIKVSDLVGQYHNYDKLKQIFHDCEVAYPNLARTGTIGKSVEGRELLYLELTHDVTEQHPERPNVKLVANMHGDETVGREILIFLAVYLLSTHHLSDRSKSILANNRLFIMPSMNPDGFEASIEGKCVSMDGYRGRHNSNHVDLNRNFPDQFDSQSMRDARTYQPETVAMMRWISSTRFLMSGNFHAAAQVASYPFDSSASYESVESKAPDDTFFKLMARTYASAHRTMSTNYDMCGIGKVFPGGITNGAAWYNVPGGMQDYNYLAGNCMEITLELTCCKYPGADRLESEWFLNKEALLEFVELSNRGVRGFIVDSTTDKPLTDVHIAVRGIDKMMLSGVHGEYFRLLVGRETPYTVRFSRAGYKAQSLDVVVLQGRATILNVSMVPGTMTPGDHEQPREQGHAASVNMPVIQDGDVR